MATVGKADLAKQVAQKLGASNAKGQEALNAVLEAVQSALAKGDKVTLTGFGTFEVRRVKERKVRAIRGQQAGSMITVPAHKRVGFKPGAVLEQQTR